MGRFTGLLGLVVLLGIAWLFSSHKHAIKLRLIAWGLGLQFLFALLVLKTGFGRVFQAIGAGVNAMLAFTEEGSKFVFGPQLGASTGPFGVVFAFQVLPIIIFIASFFSILYYLGIMQWVVRGMAIGMQKVMGVSGAESLERGGQHLHGADRSAADDPSVPGRADGIGIVHDHDRRNGARVRLGDGGLCEDRRRFDHAPADGGDHDRARHHHAGQDFRSRDRRSR